MSSRYALVDRVIEGTGWALWRGRDSLLFRDVGVVVVAKDHPRRAAVADAARAASLVTDGRFLHVYDVLDEAEDDLWLVREWVRATDLATRLTSGPLVVEEACATGIQIAQAMAAAHGQGVHHGALGPRDVLFTEDGPTKIDGLATRLVLDARPDPAADHLAAPARDSWAAAAVTYAAVTGRWPGPARDAVPAAPPGSAVTRAALVRAGLPRSLDSALADSLSRPPEDPLAVAAALARVLSSVGRRAGDTAPDRAPTGRRRGVLIAVALIVLIAAMVGALLLGLSLARDPVSAPPPPGPGSSPQPTTSVLPSPTGFVPVVAGRDFDPDGNGQEEPDLVPLAFDDNLGTAWHTVTYKQASMAPKSGVGVIFDLGRVDTVGAVRLNLLGAGSSLQVRVSRSPGEQVSDFEPFGSGTNLGDLVALRAPEPVQARYVLVWLTHLPPDGAGFRGGIAEIQVARN